MTEGDLCVSCRTKLTASAAPRLLPCLHSFCKTCFTEKRDNGVAKECPVCGQNYNLSEVADSFVFVDPVPKCGGCQETVLSGWCEQCEEALCSDCVLAHHRVKVTRNHTIRPQEHAAGLAASLHCTLHKQERLKFFCLTCDELTCRDCQLINHRGHRFLLLEETVVSEKARLLTLVDSIREQRERVKDSLLSLNGRLQGSKALKDGAKKKLASFVHSVYLMLLARGQRLYKEVEALYDEEVKNLMEQRNTLENLENRQGYVITFIQKILSTEGYGILLHKKLIDKCVNKLLSQKTQQTETMILPFLHINKDFCYLVKSYGSIKVSRVPLTGSEKNNCSSMPKDAAKEENSGHSGLNAKSASTPSVPVAAASQPLGGAAFRIVAGPSQCGTSDSSSSEASQPTTMPANSVLALLNMCDRHHCIAPSTSRTNSSSTPACNSHQSNAAEVSQAGVKPHASARSSHTNQVQSGQTAFADTLQRVPPVPPKVQIADLPYTQTSVNTSTPVLSILLNMVQNVSCSNAISVPAKSQSNATCSPTLRDSSTSQQPVQTGFFSTVPVASKHLPPHGENKAEACFTSSSHELPATQMHCTTNIQVQSQDVTRPTRNLQSALPVKAPADSLGEGNISQLDMVSPSVEDQDGNMPTSTVPETDTSEMPVEPKPHLPNSTTPGPVSSVSVENHSPNHSFISSPKSLQKDAPIPSSGESASASKHWTTNLPTSFRQVLDMIDDRAKTGDVVPTEDTSPSFISSVNEEDEEATDISDSEPMEMAVEAVQFDNAPESTSNVKRFLRVSLVELPISLPPSGSSLPQFHIIPSDQTGEILLQEIQEGKETQKILRIPALPTTASPTQSSPDSQLPAEVLDCNVCLSAGASLLCTECGRSFHTNCHVPPILRPTEVWVCSLCHNVLDDFDPFSCDRLKEPYLSLQDQRKCEQTLLTLMCEEHSYFLYRAAKYSAGCMDFDFIVGRLLGKRSPPYRTAAEMVSDVWGVFAVLLTHSKKKHLVVKLQNLFQKRLNATFGMSLHASLLSPPYIEDLKGAPETTLSKVKVKFTLKRMREFLATHSGIVAKKSHTEKRDEDSQKETK